MATLSIISAGLASPSSSVELGQLIAAPILSARDDMELKVIEIKDLGHDLIDFMTTGGICTPQLEQTIDTVTESDALIVVTPVFQASYSGIFKLFFDAIPMESLKNTPVILAANAGSQRHALVIEYAIRPLFSFFKARIVPTGILVTPADRTPEAWPLLLERIDRAANEMCSLIK